MHNFFLKIMHQLQAIISHSLNDGINFKENGEYYLLSKVAPHSNLFIDVGANKGEWSLSFIENANPEVRGLLFEPSTNTFSYLNNIFNSNLKYSKIELINSAVSDKPGYFSFYEEPGCGETASFLKDFSSSTAFVNNVKTTTIDIEVEARGIHHIDMLKIDAEGYDVHVIRGAINCLQNNIIDVVQFEYNAPYALANSTLHEALQIFNENNYEVFLLLKKGLVKFNYNIYGEFYHYSNFVALSPYGKNKYFSNF